VHVLWRVVVKELLQIRRDRKMIPVIFVAPVVQIVLFGFAANMDVTNVPTVLVDLDRSAASRDLVRRFVESGYFEIAGTEERAEAVDRWLVTSRAQVGLVIAPGFGAAIESGRGAALQIVVDGSDSSSASVALGYAGAVAQSYGAEVQQRLWRGAGRPRFGQVALVPRVFYNPDLKSRWFFVPAMLAMILMVMTLLLSAMGVVREKEIGTMEQLIVTPIRPWQLLVGKLFPFALIGVFQLCVATAVAVYGFGVPLRGSFPLFVALSTLFILCNLGLGLLVSTAVQNQQQAMMGAAFGGMVPMLYLSGLIFPIENMPRPIQIVTYGIPLRYYAEIMRGVFLRGSGLAVLWPEALVLLAMGTAIMTLASLRFRKRLD